MARRRPTLGNLTDDEIYQIGTASGNLSDIAAAKRCSKKVIGACRTYLRLRNVPMPTRKKYPFELPAARVRKLPRKRREPKPAVKKIKAKTLTLQEWIEELRSKKMGE